MDRALGVLHGIFCQTLWMQPTSGNLWFRHLESRMKDPLEKMKLFLLTNNNPIGILMLRDLEDHLVEYISRIKNLPAYAMMSNMQASNYII